MTPNEHLDDTPSAPLGLTRRHLLAVLAGGAATPLLFVPRNGATMAAPAAVVDSSALPTTVAPPEGSAPISVDAPVTTTAPVATPVGGRADGVLVVVFLAGGNDGLNTVVPIESGAYRDRRGFLALDVAETLPLADGYALNARLPTVKALWDRGAVAVVDGVGLPDPSLSHFVTMARLSSGWAGPERADVAGTGWIGRWLDGVDDSSRLVAASIGTTIPATLIGARRRAAAVATSPSSFGTASGPGADALAAAVRRLADAAALDPSTRRAGLADATVAALDDSAALAPVYRSPIDGPRATAGLVTAARLLNAGLGTRVVHLMLGEHDSHAGQIDPWDRRHGVHHDRLAELDAGLAAFFRELDPTVAERTAVLIVSEFGRALMTNGSNGTDHGTASCALLLGTGVRGGLHGDPASLTTLDGDGNLVATSDLRAVFAEVLDGWLGADSTELLGHRFDRLGLFA